MRMRQLLAAVPVVLILAGCRDARLISPADTVEQEAADASAAPRALALDRAEAAGASVAVQQPAPAQDPMLIRTGQARIEVDSLERAVREVERLAASLGGSVLNSTVVVGERERRSATIAFKVPAARFDDAMGGLRPVGRLESMNVQAVDVGEEFVDVSARLEAARQLEQRLLEILRTRTGELEDVLAVERELARVRTEIERYEGRLRYLRARVEMSQVTAELHEPVPLVAAAPGEHVLGAAARQAWRNFIGLLAAAIASLGFVLPLALITAGAWWLLRRRTGTGRAGAAESRATY